MHPASPLGGARLRSLLATLALSLSLGGMAALSGCERRVGEDERLTPTQPRPDSQPPAPAR